MTRNVVAEGRMALFDWLRKYGSSPPTKAPSLIADARRMAKCVADAPSQSGYRADFSLDSLREINRFFDEQSRGGETVPCGLLAEQLGSRIFALG
jgi:hypothetical protein